MQTVISAHETGLQTHTGFDVLKSGLKDTWMAGDYDLFARYMEDGSKPFYRRLGLASGTLVLDVACGSGQLALIAARAGASARGCDIAPNWLDKARERAAAEGLDIDFDEADAESLPYPDSQFDAVVSFFGAMFAPRPRLVAKELTRVCRPGGVIAMANWTESGFIGCMFKALARHVVFPGMPSPLLWGDETIVRERFGSSVSALSMRRRIFVFEYPFPPENVVDFFRRTYGPVARAFASLDSGAQQILRRDLALLWMQHNLAVNRGTKVEAEYLEVVATRPA